MLGAVDLRSYTLEGTNQKPTIEDVKKLNNTDMIETQKNFKKGLAETIQFIGIPSDERIEEEIANQKSAKGKQRLRQYYAK